MIPSACLPPFHRWIQDLEAASSGDKHASSSDYPSSLRTCHGPALAPDNLRRSSLPEALLSGDAVNDSLGLR